MTALRFLCVAIAAISPDIAVAHEAFGDLGPFYTHMLHPAVDPAQGLVLVGTGALLARQPIEAVRPAYAIFALAAALGISVLAVLPLTAPAMRMTGATAIVLGVLVTIGLPLPRWFVALICAAMAAMAAVSFEMSGTAFIIVQKAFGGALGLAVTVLFVWGTLDWTAQRVHPIATAVAGSWITAAGLLVLAIPA
ncbi:MAG: hypothetical protein B7Y80_20390 [Hyphomicrobium sp. 32-62-53]|jgi:urease accessory protein|nr:MAG: hypothetical protein B7Z29_20305 [Hyphomicrobium sp. 12-62-95]OYX97242.1 MAG: hypothetical protein B7Y80_20390 [Hyphomicrobium sp. 32-62-53]